MECTDASVIKEVLIWGNRTLWEKCFIVLNLVIVLITIILAIYFATQMKETGEQVGAPKVQVVQECKGKCLLAKTMKEMMNVEVDPCTNFPEYACGGFNQMETLKGNRDSVNAFTKTEDLNFEVMKSILEEEIVENDYEYVKRMKTFYMDCLDANVDRDYKAFKDSMWADNWPTLNPDWNDTDDFNDLVKKYGEMAVNPLFSFEVAIDPSDTSKHALKFSPPLMLMDIQQYYMDFVEELGARDSNATKTDPEGVAKLIDQLAKGLSLLESDSVSNEKQTTLGAMDADYAGLLWKEAIQPSFPSGVNLTSDVKVYITDDPYFKMLSSLMTGSDTDKRAVQNYFSFEFARQYLGNLNQGIVQLGVKYNMVKFGSRYFPTTEHRCVKVTGEVFKAGMGKQFAMTTDSDEKYSEVMNIYRSVKAAFESILMETSFLDNVTNTVAQKLQKMKSHIGVPSKHFTHDELDEMYREFDVYTGNGSFYLDCLEVLKESHRDQINLAKLSEPVENDMVLPPGEMEVQMINELNAIDVTIAMLQKPIYSHEYPSFVNFARIGSMIGQQMLHGFDQIGRDYANDGRTESWWDEDAISAYPNLTECVSDQYSSYKVNEINTTLEGERTVHSDVADIEGLKAAYKAYQTSSSFGEKPLEGLGDKSKTIDQQFFLAYSQVFCSKETPEFLKAQIETYDTSPNLFRMLGSLQNNDDFAKAYNCKVDDEMNPLDKCTVWGE